jgi:ATP-dependent DNA helicase RecG
MPVSSAEFLAWLGAPEGPQLEFKTARQDYDFEKLAKYCVALANEGGGVIILGVTDARPREVVGTAAFPEPGRTEAGLHQRLHHRIPVEEYLHEGKRVLVVRVPARLLGNPWSYEGRHFKRAGDELTYLGDAELRAIHAEVAPDFSAQPSDASIDDLDPAALAEFRRRWSRKARNPRIESHDDLSTLRNAELLVDERPCQAAVILFGTRATLTRYLAQAEIVFEYRSSEASGPAADRVEYRNGFFSVFDDLWQRINQRNDRQSYQEDFFRYEIPTFDEVAIREALLNAIAHREYRLPGSIFVRQFARRLEIVNPGGFPPGITPENIVDQQNPRNRRLAETLARAGLVERSGQGMNLMIESAIRQTKPLPSFSGSAPHEVRLTLPGTVQNPAFIRFLQRLGDERLAAFSTADYLALDALQRDLPQPLPSHLASRLPGLVEVGAVERIGRGTGARYLLSRALYAALGQPGIYTRRRGLDHETNKALIEKHLCNAIELGAPISEILQVLPALSRVQIKRLLLELEEEGRAHLRGLKRGSRWHLGPQPRNGSNGSPAGGEQTIQNHSNH